MTKEQSHFKKRYGKRGKKVSEQDIQRFCPAKCIIYPTCPYSYEKLWLGQVSANFLLPTVYCLLSTAYCLLPTT